MSFSADSNFLEVLKTIFPDAHSLTTPSIKLLTRMKSTGLDLRHVDFLGRVEGVAALGTINNFIKDSLSITFECSYGKITVSNTKIEGLHFTANELLELSRTQSISLIMLLKGTFDADILFPVKQNESINIFAVPKFEI